MDNESSQIEAVDFGSNCRLGVCFLHLICFWFYVYLSLVFRVYYHWQICLLIWLFSSSFFFLYRFFFSFFSFCVCVYASLYDFVCIALLLPFVPGLSMFVLFVLFLSIVFSACYHWQICFWVWLLSSFSLSFFYYFLIFFICNNYFNNFIFFNLFFPFFLSFFLPFLWSHVADRVLVLRPGVRPVPLRWESRVQDIGPPETSQVHIISNGESSPRDLHLNAKTQLHSTTSKLQCWTPYAKRLARQEDNPTCQQRGCLKS